MESLVSTEWLAGEMGASDLRIVDCTRHQPVLLPSSASVPASWAADQASPNCESKLDCITAIIASR